MNAEMIRLIDSISRDRNVEKEALFVDIEQSLVSAARKHFNALETEVFTAEVDRETGAIRVWRGEEEIPLKALGRIPAQTAKQVMIQRFREDERTSIYNDFIDRKGELATGMAQRYEGGSLVISIERAEGFMPRSEQIKGEQHQPGERVRCLILDVRDRDQEGRALNQVKIVLSRASPEFIRRLFEVEVPEVAERVIEIKAMAREAGHRTKLAVSSIDTKVDAVGACVGVRGSRIKNIVDELGGEKIDIVRWNDSSQLLIENSLKPAEVVETSLCFELGRATVVVKEDQLSLAIGKRGQNVRLAARLTNWDLDILTPAEFTKSLDIMEKTLASIEGVTEEHVDRIAALGVISVFDVEEVGVEYVAETLGVDEATAKQVVRVSADRAKTVAEEQAKEKAQAEQRKKEEAAALEAMPGAAQAAAVLGEISPEQAEAAAGSGGYSNATGGQSNGQASEAAETGGEESGTEGGGEAGAPRGEPGSIVEMLEARQTQEVRDHQPGDADVDYTEDHEAAVDIEARPEGEAPVGETRDQAAAEDSDQSDVQAARAADAAESGQAGQSVESPWEPNTNPTGSDANSVELTEAAQEGSSAEMLADETAPEAGTVAAAPVEAHEQAGQSRASSPTGEFDPAANEQAQAEVTSEPQKEADQAREEGYPPA